MAHEELKQRQSVMWGKGPYQRITETITDVHDVVVERLAPESGDRWLDLACGTGALAERAAAAGARVTGLDLAPVLIETAKERAAELGLEIEYVVGDVERCAFPGRELRQGLLDLRDHVCPRS
jgi:2-polyprenyl-3-methyl-5-hydroxy-6-metoxy-1,4-benzoquinol methylase